MDPVTFTFLLGRLGRLTEAVATDVCARVDLTPAELRVLSYLAHSDGGTASPRSLARFIVQTSGGLTATLHRLEQQHLIERRPDPADGRGRLVVLTELGRARQHIDLNCEVRPDIAIGRDRTVSCIGGELRVAS